MVLLEYFRCHVSKSLHMFGQQLYSEKIQASPLKHKWFSFLKPVPVRLAYLVFRVLPMCTIEQYLLSVRCVCRFKFDGRICDAVSFHQIGKFFVVFVQKYLQSYPFGDLFLQVWGLCLSVLESKQLQVAVLEFTTMNLLFS